jgi:hypothetical protein
MGFLDDLKRQAGSLQSRQGEDLAALAHNTQVVEAAARQARMFLMELSASLQVLQPAPARRYVLDRQVVVGPLPQTTFRFDARRKILRDQEVLDHIVMGCGLRTGQQVVLDKDFVNETERLEARLQQAGIHHEREPVRDPATGRLQCMRYSFTADVLMQVTVQPAHDTGQLHFELRNLDALETLRCTFDAREVGSSRLDELARWWVGEPHRFLDGAQQLRRTEAR